MSRARPKPDRTCSPPPSRHRSPRTTAAPAGRGTSPSLDVLLTRVAAPALAERVARVAGGLRAAGVEPGDAVAWQSANRDEVGVLYRACWRLGAIAAPVHHQMGPADVAGVLAAVEPTFVVADLDALPDGGSGHRSLDR